MPTLTAPTSLRAPTLADVVYTDHDGIAQHLDVYPADSPWAPLYDGAVFVHLHGGGWRAGDKQRLSVASRLASQGLTTISANYTLTPEKPYPRNLDDVFDLVAYVHAQQDALGIRAEHIVLGGASAGGHLSALAATKGTAQARLAVPLGGVVSWFAPLSPESRYLTHRYPTEQYPGGFWDRGLAPGEYGNDPFRPFIGTDDFASITLREAWDADPRFHLDQLDARDLPPFLLLSGTRDSVEIQSSQRQLFDALSWVGADVQLLTLERADHESPRYLSSAAQGAVLGFVRGILETAHPQKENL
ncbi:alpha/beta hydrolase [Microbacterium protaetiae]|nr:alpha/beta hydrolase [Microbacterium protaetiae]